MKFQLDKGIEQTKFVLAKKNVSPTLRAQVGVNLDVSGSAKPLFESGQMQEAFQRVMPIGVTFDDNGEVDVFTFQSGANIAQINPTANKSNFPQYIKDSVLNNRSVPLWGGTDYAPVIKKNLEAFGFYKKSFMGMAGSKLQANSTTNMPVTIYFMTDGENNDKEATRKILQECQDAGCQIYFLFIGIGTGSSFDFLKKIGDEFKNTGFLSVSDMKSFENDDQIYDQLLPTELCQWLSAIK